MAAGMCSGATKCARLCGPLYRLNHRLELRPQLAVVRLSSLVFNPETRVFVERDDRTRWASCDKITVHLIGVIQISEVLKERKQRVEIVSESFVGFDSVDLLGFVLFVAKIPVDARQLVPVILFAYLGR